MKVSIKLIVLLTAFVIVCIIAIFAYYKANEDQMAIQKAQIHFEQVKLEAENKAATERKLDACLSSAEKAHWDYLSINGSVATDEKTGREKVQAAQYVWKIADAAMKDEKDNCFRRYQR